MAETLTLQPSKSCVISEVPGEIDKNMHPSTVQGTADYSRYALLAYDISQEYWYLQINDAYINIPYSGSGRMVYGYLLDDFDADTATYEIMQGKLRYKQDSYLREGMSPEKINSIEAIRASACIPNVAGNPTANGIYIQSDNSPILPVSLAAKPSLFLSLTSNKRYCKMSFMYVNGEYTELGKSWNFPTEFEVDTTQPTTFEIISTNSEGDSLVNPKIETVKFRYYDGTSFNDLVFNGSIFTIQGDTMRKTIGHGYITVSITSTSGENPLNERYIKPVAKPKPFISFSPNSGSFVDRRKDYTFSFQPNAGVTGSYFNYRLSTASKYTTIALDGATKYTLPADTITVGADYVFYWQVQDRYGVDYKSEQMAFTTLESISTASPVSPSGGIEDIDNPVAFIWTHNTSTGSPQTKADLQISTDGTEWTALTTVEGAETMYTLPAKGLAVGTWYWRVRTYNLDGIAGEWSAAAQFLAVGSPPTPVLNIVDASPRPTIAWQVTDQEAWELTIDGVTETNYGTGKRWTSPYYLADGQHRVSVRVQNKYGRWSNPGSLIVEVQNAPGGAINLTVTTGESAALMWGGGYDFYLVERDGVPIARMTETEYTDLLSVGLCSYQIRGCYAESYNYGLSNLVEVDIIPDVPVLIDLKSGDILRLPLSEQQHRTWAWSRSISANSYHVAGRALPSVDVGEYIDESLSGTVSFDEAADIRAFNGMLGRLVCLKTDGGDMAIGILTALNKSAGLFFASYSIAVTSADFDEEIRLD